MPIHSDSSNLSTYNHRLFADQVQKQYEHTIFGTAATLINGIILVFVLRTHVQQLNLIIWLTVACTISASRLILHWRYDRSTNQKSHPERWNVYFNVTLFLSGLLWGSTAIFLFPSESTGHQAFVALITGGMVAGAVGAFTAVFESFFLFSIPAVLPIGIRFFLIGGEIHVAMGLMVLLFLLIISLTAARMHADIFSLLSLKYERSTLIADLQQEVHRRKAAQEDLHMPISACAPFSTMPHWLFGPLTGKVV